MSLSDIIDPNTGAATWKHFYVDKLNIASDLVIGGDIDLCGNLTIINADPIISIKNNGGNINRASLDLYGDLSNNIAVSRIQQDASGSLHLENFQTNANINLSTTGSGANIRLVTDGLVKLLGTNYPATTALLKLDTSRNIVPVSAPVVTPVTITIGGGSTGITYSTNQMIYYVIGNALHYNINITLTSKGSSTGVVKIVTLPFTSSIVASFGYNIGSTSWSNFTLTASYTRIAAIIGSGTTEMLLYEEPQLNLQRLALTNNSLNDNSNIFISGFYFI